MHIIIADDHALFRDTISHYIHRAQPTYRLHMAANLGEVMTLLNEKKIPANLCILDFRMPGIKGPETFRNLREKYPTCNFAVMSGVAEEQDIQNVLATGVHGYLPKTLPGRTMLKAIEEMLQGGKYIPLDEKNNRLVQSFVSETTNNKKPEEKAPFDFGLTKREREVLYLLCQGKSNKEIADDLSLKVVTVKLHLRGIFAKLGCENRTSAAMKARQAGIVN